MVALEAERTLIWAERLDTESGWLASTPPRLDSWADELDAPNTL